MLKPIYRNNKMNYYIIKHYQKIKRKIIYMKRLIYKKIIDINNQILFIIIKLQSISEKINDIAMKNNHLKNEKEYIDDLMDKMNIKEEDKIAKIKK